MDTLISDSSVEMPIANEASEAHPFQFTGTAKEYFGIWVVNLFLTIVTLGIYSPWAKVRKLRYFYGHTHVADANFEYHGDPIAILKGRLIALVAFVSYSALGHFMPKMAVVFGLILFAAAPWFISRSMAFGAYNSSYRNIRFRFHGQSADVLRVIWPVVLILILGFFMPEMERGETTQPPPIFWWVFGLQAAIVASLYPYLIGSLKRLHVNLSAFGTTGFATDISIKAFYKIYLRYSLVVVLVFVVLVAGIGLIAIVPPLFGIEKQTAVPVFVVLMVLAYLVAVSILLAYTRVRVSNAVFNATSLGGQIRFASTLSVETQAKIYLGNLIAIVLTLGFAVPWATIRMMRYRAECLKLQTTVPIDDFVGQVSAHVSATGEELGEFFNVDLSL